MCFTFLKFVLQNKLQILGRFNIIVIIISCLGLQHCQKGPDFLKSYGTETNKNIVLDRPCLKLRVGQKFKLFITSDISKPEQINIQYGSNVIDKIRLEWQNDIYVLEDKNTFNWVRRFKVQPVCTMNIHKLNVLDIQGAASINFLDTLQTDQIDETMKSVDNQKLLINCGNLYGSGANTGHVDLAGRGTIFSWSCENGSSVDAVNLRSDDAYINHYTAREIRVNPENKLIASVFGAGNIVYLRDPLVKLEIKELGTGRVIKR